MINNPIFLRLVQVAFPSKADWDQMHIRLADAIPEGKRMEPKQMLSQWTRLRMLMKRLLFFLNNMNQSKLPKEIKDLIGLKELVEEVRQTQVDSDKLIGLDRGLLDNRGCENEDP